jgi:serine/threonine-protein kinase
VDRPDDSAGGVLPGRYRDPVRIATGGMGAVYRAHDERLGRAVAVKVPSDAIADDPTARARFRREAVSGARIHHPNVALVYDVGEHRGRPFMVMELVPGGTVEDRLARGRPPRATALAWIGQAAAALDAAHAAGVVHRDVKPANLLLDGQGRVKVADFGIARVLGEGGTTLTEAGTVLGSSGYAAPEQAQGLPATPASDVYALGGVAFELLTGERPFAPRTGVAELTAHAYAPVPSARERDPGLPPGVDAVLARALAKDPAARFASAGALASALREALAHPGQPTAVMPAAPPPARPRRRLRPAIVAAAAAAIAVVGATLAATLADDDPGRRAPPAGAASQVRTVVQTVTRDAPAPAPAPVADDPVALTDRSTAALQAGDAATGLALAERALLALDGTGQDYEGNASYNRGRALIDLGRCKDAMRPLRRALEIGGTDWQVETRRAALEEARGCRKAG